MYKYVAADLQQRYQQWRCQTTLKRCRDTAILFLIFSSLFFLVIFYSLYILVNSIDEREREVRVIAQEKQEKYLPKGYRLTETITVEEMEMWKMMKDAPLIIEE